MATSALVHVKISTSRAVIGSVGIGAIFVGDYDVFRGYEGKDWQLADSGNGRKSATAVVQPTYPNPGCLSDPHPRQIVMIKFQDKAGWHSEIHLVPFTWLDNYPSDTSRCHPPQ